MRWIKFVLLLLSGIIVFCLALIAIVLVAFDNDDYRKLAIRSVKRFAGYEMMIEGPFAVDLSLEPSLSAEGVRFEPVSDGSPPPLTSVGQFHIKVALLPLLSGKVVIKRLLVDDAMLSFDIDRGEKDAGPKLGKKRSGIVIPIVESATLRNIHVNVVDKDTGHVERIILRQFDVDDVHDAGPLYVKGEGAVNANEFQIEGRLGALADILKADQPYPLALKLTVADFVATVSGTVVDLLRGQGLNLQLVAEEPELANLLNALQINVPPMGRLKFETMLSGDVTAPSLSNLNLTVSGGYQVELTAMGSITNVITSEGADIRLSGSCRNRDILRLITSEELEGINEIKFKGHLRNEEGDYTIEDIDAVLATDKDLAIKADGRLRLGQWVRGPLIKEVNVGLHLSSPNTEALRPFLMDALPELGPVEAQARLLGSSDRLALEDLVVRRGGMGPLRMESRGRIGWIPLEADKPISEIELSCIIEAEQSRLLTSLLDIPLEEIGAVSLTGHVRGSEDKFQIEELELRTADGQGLMSRLTGSLRFSRRETGETIGDVDLKLRITAPNMGAAAPILGARLLPGLGPLQAEAQVKGTTEIISLENIAITAGKTDVARMEWRGRIGKVPLGEDQPASDVLIFASIEASKTSALASLAGISVPNFGPLQGSWRVVDRNGIYGFNDVKIVIGDAGKFQLEGTGVVDSVVRGHTVAVEGIDMRFSGHAPDTHAISKLLGQELPDLGPFRLKAHVKDRRGRLDIETFEMRAGPQAKATFLMKGRVTDIRNRQRTKLYAEYETASQPWLAKYFRSLVTESHQFGGTIRLTGATDQIRIDTFQIATKDLGCLSLEAKGGIKYRPGLPEIDVRLSSEAGDPAAIGSMLGVSLPQLAPLAIKGRYQGKRDKHVFEGEARFGDTRFEGTIDAAFKNQRPQIVANISAPTVYLVDVGFYPNGTSDDFVAPPAPGPSGVGRLFDDTPLSFEALKAFDLALNFGAEEITGKDVAIKKVDFHVSLADGRLRIGPSKLRYMHGTLSMDATLDAAVSKPKMDVKIIAEDVDIDDLLAYAHRPMIFKGQLNLVVDLRSSGGSARELASTLNGEFGVAIENGKIQQNVELLASDAFDVLFTFPAQKKYTDLYCMATRMIFKDGIGTIRPFYLATPKVRAQGIGSVNLASESIDLIIHPMAKRRLFRRRSSVRIHGSLAKPSVKKVPSKEAAVLTGQILAPYIVLPADALGYLWSLIKNDKDEQRPCFSEVLETEKLETH